MKKERRESTMVIKVAMLSENANYIKRMSANFNSLFSDKLELYLFTNQDKALEALSTQKIDVFLSDGGFEIDQQKVPKKCGFAYLTDTPDIDTIRGERTVCKFQKAELIYKEILDIYSENVSEVIGFRTDGSRARVILFTSAAGGTGCSTAAAACAGALAAKGKRALYFPLSMFERAEVLFHADGTADFSNVLYALKSKKSNFALKIESCVRRDETGVSFFQSSPSALDMVEFRDEEMKMLMEVLESGGDFDFLILDAPFALEGRVFEMVRKSVQTIFVTNGSLAANDKTIRALEAIRILDEQREDAVMSKVRLLYNGMDEKAVKMPGEWGALVMGQIRRVESRASVSGILAQTDALTIFGQFM